MLPRLFVWVDTHPTVYLWLLATAVALLGIALIRMWSATGSGPVRGRLFVALALLLMLCAWRWPYLFDPRPLNPDEPVYIAGALTLARDPGFWHSLDSLTAGPLCAFALLPTHWLGVPQDYFNARLVGLLLVGGTLCLLGDALRRQWNGRVALVALVPPTLLLGSTVDGDFLHYGSEHVPLFLLASSGWLLMRARNGSRIAWRASALVAGLLPWAKLQAAPFAIVLGIAAIALARRTEALRPAWRRRCADYVVCGAIPTAGLLAVIVASGQGRNFLESYLLNNLSYAAVASVADGLRTLVRLSLFTAQVPAYLVTPALLVVVSAALALATRAVPRPAWWFAAFATAIAAAAILAPRRGFQHYLLFLVLPLTWWSAAALAELLARVSAPRRQLALCLAVVAPALLLQVGARLRQPLPAPLGQLAESWRLPHDEIGDTVRLLRRPGDRLATWGWNSHLYVETGLPPATREAQTERQIRASAQRDTYYRPRLLAELRHAPPAFFVDAVGLGAFQFFDRTHDAHESFPELAAFVAERYELVADYRDCRLFVRRDRSRDAATIAGALATAAQKKRPPPEPAVEMNVLPGRPGRTLAAEQAVSMMEPPASVEWTLRGSERTFGLEYGYDPRAYENAAQGNGTEFSVVLTRPDGTSAVLFHRLLDPAHARNDQGPQFVRLRLPPTPVGSRLVLHTSPGPYNDNAWDWAWAANAGFGRGPQINPRFAGAFPAPR